MEFNKKVLASGLTVLHEKRDVPVTTVMLAVKYGGGFDSVEQKGLAHFLEHLCFKGTEKRSAKQIAEEVERVGGDLNAFTGEEITAYHVKLPSDHLEIAMDVVFDIFFNANFPGEEIEREANVVCEEIKMYKDNPRAWVVDNIKRNLYSEPFGMFLAGTEENVRGFGRDDILKRHREVYVPKNAVLSVVGNNDFEDVLKLAEKFVVGREGIEVSFPKIDLKKEVGEDSRTGIEQANVAVAVHFPLANSKEYYAAEVFNAIFGEGMSSKLFTEVREKKGLVYGVRSEVDAGVGYGYLFVWAGTEAGKVDEVEKVCVEEFGKMAKISEDELAQAKVQVIGNWKVESEDSNKVATDLVLEEFASDARDYYDYEKKINAVTLDDIRDLASRMEEGYARFRLVPF